MKHIKTIAITITSIIAIWGIYKAWDVWLVDNHNSLYVEKIQFILFGFLIIFCFGLAGLMWVLWQKQINYDKEVDDKIDKKINQKFYIFEKGANIQFDCMNEKLEYITRLHEATIKQTQPNDSLAMQILRERGLA